MSMDLFPMRVSAGKNHIAPLVEEMLDRLGREVDRYERVVQYWPVFGPQLEGAACAALRDTTSAVSRQCGLTQVTREEARRQPGSYLRGPATYDSGYYSADNCWHVVFCWMYVYMVLDVTLRSIAS